MTVGVRCHLCGRETWVEKNDPRLPSGIFECGVCDLSGWETMAAFTGPAEMILVETDGGSTLLDVLDSFGQERIRVVVYRKATPKENTN